MIALFTYILAWLLVFAIFRSPIDRKMAILFIACMLFTSIRMPLSPFKVPFVLFCYTFIFTELTNFREHLQTIKRTIIWWSLLLYIIGACILIYTSPHLSDFESTRLFLRTWIFTKYFLLAYAFVAFKRKEDIISLLNFSKYAMLLLTFWGVVNFITKSTVFLNAITSDYGNLDFFIDRYQEATRFRVQSMFANPFDYGFISVVVLLTHLYGYNNNYTNKRDFTIVILCSLFGIITCGCRTIIVCTIFSIFMYCRYAYHLEKKIMYGITTLLIFILSYNLSTTVQIRTQQIFQTFTNKEGSESASGSSISMREAQLNTVLSLIEGHQWTGRGYYFFNIDLGWGDYKEGKGRRYEDLQGLEGIYLSLLLERGIVGLAIWLIFYLSIGIYIYKKSEDNIIRGFGIAILTNYVLFAIMTGELRSVPPTLIILGYVLRNLQDGETAIEDIDIIEEQNN